MTTLFADVDVTVLTIVLAIAPAAAGVVWVLRRPPQPVDRARRRRERELWTMPLLALLDPPTGSPMRSIAIGGLWAYLVVAILLLGV